MRLLALRIAVALAVSARQLSPVGCQPHREGMKMAKNAIFRGEGGPAGSPDAVNHMAIPRVSPSLSSRKMTYLRLSVTNRCDMQCSYCRSGAELPSPDTPLSAQEIALLARAFARNGVTKIRLTGGEPLLRDDLTEIVAVLARTPGVSTIGITTNGHTFAEAASELKRAGLRRVNISLDSLDREVFRRISGRDAIDSVLRSIEVALRCGFEKVKTNTVVMRGVNDSEIHAITELAMEMPIEVRFIELMPLGHTSRAWKALYVPASEICQAIGELEPAPNEGCSSARLYRTPGGLGRVGIISPMSECFCDTCNRVRVTSTGILKPCLRSPAAVDIRPLLRMPDFDERLAALLRDSARDKLVTHTPAGEAVSAEAMCAIGG